MHRQTRYIRRPTIISIMLCFMSCRNNPSSTALSNRSTRRSQNNPR